jgi:polyhydroxybutyrate depolymerase
LLGALAVACSSDATQNPAASGASAAGTSQSDNNPLTPGAANPGSSATPSGNGAPVGNPAGNGEGNVPGNVDTSMLGNMPGSGAGGGQANGMAMGSAGAASQSGACPGTLKAGDSNQTIMSGGLSRRFIVHLPTSFTGSAPLPVVFDFHPLGGTGASQQRASGWGTKCDSEGCIAVFPDSGPGDNSWNVGYCCSNSQQQRVDDVQFTRDMIKFLEASTCVDAKRIYASGCSNGGGMSYKLACDAADVIAAVAPVDFRCITGQEPANAASLTATNNTACTCTLPRPISVMQFDEGRDNNIVPFNGGRTVVPANCPPGGNCAAFSFPSAQVNFETWASFNTCTGEPSANPGNPICQTYASCAADTEVSLCTADSANHCGSYGLSKIVDTAWDMFQKQALP